MVGDNISAGEPDITSYKPDMEKEKKREKRFFVWGPQDLSNSDVHTDRLRNYIKMQILMQQI